MSKSKQKKSPYQETLKTFTKLKNEIQSKLAMLKDLLKNNNIKEDELSVCQEKLAALREYITKSGLTTHEVGRVAALEAQLEKLRKEIHNKNYMGFLAEKASLVAKLQTQMDNKEDIDPAILSNLESELLTSYNRYYKDLTHNNKTMAINILESMYKFIQNARYDPELMEYPLLPPYLIEEGLFAEFTSPEQRMLIAILVPPEDSNTDSFLGGRSPNAVVRNDSFALIDSSGSAYGYSSDEEEGYEVLGRNPYVFAPISIDDPAVSTVYKV